MPTALTVHNESGRLLGVVPVSRDGARQIWAEPQGPQLSYTLLVVLPLIFTYHLLIPPSIIFTKLLHDIESGHFTLIPFEEHVGVEGDIRLKVARVEGVIRLLPEGERPELHPVLPPHRRAVLGRERLHAHPAPQQLLLHGVLDAAAALVR